MGRDTKNMYTTSAISKIIRCLKNEFTGNGNACDSKEQKVPGQAEIDLENYDK